MAYSRDYPNSIIPKGSKVVECLQNDDKELKRILGILSDIGVMSLFGSKRQCVLYAATGTDGKPSYLTATGLNVAINGSATPVIVTFAGGYNANGTVDKTDTIVDTVNAWKMPANGTYYLYIDKDMSTGILSYGYTTIPDTYATTAPESPTLDQCYFNTVDMKMYHYNSSAWEQKLRVFVAKAVTTADTATLTIYPFTSRTTASNFIQYDGNGNLQAVDLVGALTQFSASKFIGALHGNADTATKATNDKNGADIAATYLPKSGGTITGDISWTGERHISNSNSNSGFFASDTSAGIYDWKNSRSVIQYTQSTNTIGFGNASATFAGTVSAPNFSGHLVGTADNATNADNANKLDGYSIRFAQGGNWGSVPLIYVDGVMRVGKYIDWHAVNDVNKGYTSRFTAENDGTVTVGTINGTLNGTLNGYTAAQLIGETSHNINGYHKFPDGTIIQWGYFSATSAGYATISFPIAFPTACLNVQKTSGANGDNTGDERYLRSWSTTNFRTGYDSAGCTWLAIGY